MKNLNDITKNKWVLLTIGVILALSMVLNIFLYFNRFDSILSRTHKVDKQITIGEITWAGIKVGYNYSAYFSARKSKQWTDYNGLGKRDTP